MTGPGVFDVALTGDDERRMAKTAAQDKLAAAIYDVRAQFGDWLFGATDRQGFQDRVAMCRTAICHTIEPHTHAGIGVQTKVIKALEREWRQRSACYPGCDKNEAHAAKFHKDKSDDTEKEASRRRAEFEDHQEHPELHNQSTYQDHEGQELIPEGNFEGYKDRVDQGGPEKVDSHSFIPGSHDQQHNESGDDNFVKKVTGRHLQRRQQIIADASQNYLSMLAMLRTADDTTGNDPNAGTAGVGTAPGAAAPPAPNMTTTTSPAGAPGAATPAAAPMAPVQGMPMTASFHEMTAMLVNERAATWAQKAIVQSGSLGARVRLLEASRGRGIDHIVDAFVPVYSNRQKCADRNYLQQADEALTKVLNEKAEEFQNTIAPLQQALITIQQAEQLSSPLAVQPPAGTVNVLPQGAQGNAAAAPSGQVPQLGADPAAAMLAGQPPAGGQQMAASRGRRPFDRQGGNVNDAGGPYEPTAPHGSPEDMANRGYVETYQGRPVPKGRSIHEPGVIEEIMRQPAPKVPRHADVNAEYQSWLKKKPGLPTGGEVDIDSFAEQKHVGPRAKQTLQKSQGMPTMARRRRAAPEPGYVWSKSPESTQGEFASRVASGETPDSVYRKMIAEITDHHSRGMIGSHDAHRAANEAFGRLLLARRGEGKQRRPFV